MVISFNISYQCQNKKELLKISNLYPAKNWNAFHLSVIYPSLMHGLFYQDYAYNHLLGQGYAYKKPSFLCVHV